MSRKSKAKKSKRTQPSRSARDRLSNKTTRRSLIKRPGRSGLIALLCLIVAGLGFVYLQSTVPISFTAQLSNAGNASFSYGTKQSDTYSPACGCMADKAERWRGITFAARRLRLTSTLQAPHTAYWLMSAEPDHLTWSPSMFRPHVKLLRLLVRYDKALDLSELQTGHGDGVELIDEAEFASDDAVALVTNRSVDLRLLDDFPIAAYSPVESSTVSIAQPEATFQTDWNPTVIREQYEGSPAHIGPTGNVASVDDDLAYPMIDLVGSSLILTTDDPQAVLLSATRTASPMPGSRPSWRGMYVIIVRSPFSTRVSIMPLGQDTTDSRHDRRTPEDYQKFTNPDRPARPLGPDEEVVTLGGGPVFLPTAVERRSQGTVEVAILERLSSTEYGRIRDALRRKDKVEAHGIRSRVPELDHIGMEFRYPPIPPLDGFNVFGLLKELILDVNHGHIMVGASSVPIDASSVVELRNIRAFTPRGNVIPIPLVGNTTEQSLEFSIEATSELLINRVPVGVRADRLRVVIQVASVIAMLIGALAGLVTLLTWIRVTRKGSLQVPPGSI